MKSILKNILLFILLLFIKEKSLSQQLHHLKLDELVQLQLISKAHTKKFQQLQIQDFQGRIKPIHTLALDLLRK